MAEKNLDFDTVIDRTHTNSLKYDFAVQRGKPKDVLPLWVADMDFQVSSYIQEALSGSVAHGIFGYSEAEGSYFEAVAGWMSRHYGWNVEETWLVKTPGIVFALAQAVRAFIQPVTEAGWESVRRTMRAIGEIPRGRYVYIGPAEVLPEPSPRTTGSGIVGS